MNNGLAVLAAWAQWVLVLGVLAIAVLRHVARDHDDERSLYRRPDDDGERAPGRRSDADG